MDDVIVHVTGNQYPLGSINLNSKATALVSASGESHIEISYSDKGIPRRLVVNCYFEPGYKGRILIELSNGKISKITDNIEIGKY